MSEQHETDYWHDLYLAERNKRLAAEDELAKQEERRSDRPEQVANEDWEIELCQP